MTDRSPAQPAIAPRQVRGAPVGQQSNHDEERDNPGQMTGGTGGMGTPPPREQPIDEPVPDPVALPPGSHAKDGSERLDGDRLPKPPTDADAEDGEAEVDENAASRWE